eukprot:4107253-Amphidinium_carterae.1
MEAAAVESLPMHIDAAQFAIDVFAGQCGITFGLLLSEIVCLKPWDLTFGDEYDVLQHGDLLRSLARANKLVWAALAVPCQSMTFARHPPLRSVTELYGVSKLSEHHQRLVETGNALFRFSVSLAKDLHMSGGYFTMENPELSWLWVLHEVQELLQLPGVGLVLTRFSEFGTAYAKPTLFMYNTPNLHKLHGKRDARATVVLRGFCMWEGQQQWQTHVAQPYPPALAAKYGALAAEAIQLREQSLCNGLSTPYAIECLSDALHDKLNCILAEVAQPPQPGEVPHGMGATVGMSVQQHVLHAVSTSNPLLREQPMSQDLAGAIAFEITRSVDEIDRFRAEVIAYWSQRALDLREQQGQWLQSVPPPLQKLVSRLHVPLIQELFRDMCFDD